MSDEHDQPDLSADEDSRVRRLLAEAGGPVATPPEVVARLDATLVDLVAARAASDPDEAAGGTDPGATVVTLTARRRRWPRVLLAAAAVVVGGYAVGSAVTGTMSGGSADSGGSSDSTAADSARIPEAASGNGSTTTNQGSVPDQSAGKYELVTPTPHVSSNDFVAGVRKVAGPTAASAQPQDNTQDQGDGELSATRARAGSCVRPPSTRQDRWFAIRYDGRRATLVVSPVHDSLLQAQVYSCDGTTLLRDQTVDVP